MFEKKHSKHFWRVLEHAGADTSHGHQNEGHDGQKHRHHDHPDVHHGHQRANHGKHVGRPHWKCGARAVIKEFCKMLEKQIMTNINKKSAIHSPHEPIRKC